jgi:hypothetical protein
MQSLQSGRCCARRVIQSPDESTQSPLVNMSDRVFALAASIVVGCHHG